MEPYFTILVPFVGRKHRTEWHPTDDTGPFSTLTRGNFKSIDDAIAWGQAKLNGTPYTIALVDEEGVLHKG